MEGERARDPAAVEYGELPELTSALRAFGSARRGGVAQMLVFGPLLEARKRAAAAHAPHGRVRAFDATDLGRALERAIDRVVAEWPDERLSARRALRAELTERVQPYAAMLTLLSRRAAAVLDADEGAQLRAWRAWTVQLAAVFDAADRAWIAIRAVVESISRPRPS